MSQGVSTENQEEYEDDFEKDLDWLISEEEGQTDDQGPAEEIESEIDKELLEEDKEERGRKEKKKKIQKAGKAKKATKEMEVMEEEERWPSPMEPVECDLEGDGPPTAPPPPLASDDQEEVDEEKKYILEKIQQANRELQDQEAPDASRHRRLHFKDNLVDLVVPPLEYERGGTPAGAKAEGRERSGRDRANGTEAEKEVSGRLSELKISPRQGSVVGGGPGEVRATAEAEGSSQAGHGGKEGRVLVEKDGKFELVSLKEMESQGLLPPLANHPSETTFSSPRPQEPVSSPNKTPAFSSAPPQLASASFSQQGVAAPRPPAKPRNRPNSASHSQRDIQRRTSTNRRVQSATGAPCQATYTLSPQQKELLQRSQERKERLAKEVGTTRKEVRDLEINEKAEQKKREEEEQKRQENEAAFRAWLIRKRGQFQEERRIHRAQEMERMNSSKRDASDPDVAFRSWLHRKQEQQQRDRQLEEMRRLEQEGGIYIHNPVESDRAFRTWLKRKRAEKRVEQQAARERSRRLVVEERRARRTQDLLCAVNDMKPFRFSEHLAYRF